MSPASIHFVGTELYFDDLDQARSFYVNKLGLQVADEQPGHYTKFNCGAGFICLERKGSESYPSLDKAVLFFEVADLQAAIDAIGPERVVQRETRWAALHDPEGHNILLLQAGRQPPK